MKKSKKIYSCMDDYDPNSILIDDALKEIHKIHEQNRLGEFETYTPSAFVVDFVVAYDYKNQNITVQLKNLFNEEYYNHLSRIKNITPEAGRNIHLVYKIML